MRSYKKLIKIWKLVRNYKKAEEKLKISKNSRNTIKKSKEGIFKSSEVRIKLTNNY